MRCQKCKSERVITINGKVSDCFDAHVGENDYDGYVPADLGVGSGDYINFEYCADCGQIQGEFPLQPTDLEGRREDDDDEPSYDEE
jgi:hypothetical protein